MAQDNNFKWDDGSSVSYDWWENHQPETVDDRWDCGFTKTGAYTFLLFLIL